MRWQHARFDSLVLNTSKSKKHCLPDRCAQFQCITRWILALSLMPHPVQNQQHMPGPCIQHTCTRMRMQLQGLLHNCFTRVLATALHTECLMSKSAASS